MECVKEVALRVLPGEEETQDFLLRFSEKVLRARVPVSGGLELTRRCNLTCVHCYNYDRHQPAPRSQELDTAQWQGIIDQLVEAGCLMLLMTGGEPLLRPDFPELYRYAVEKGLLVSVFTNGLLVNERIADLFAELPPQAVEITLYGATPENYERVTGSALAQERVLQGVRRLLDRRVRLALKTVLMDSTRAEFEQMRAIARGFGVPFRYDSALFPRLTGDQKPVDFRLPPEDVVAIEMADAKDRQWWGNYKERMTGLRLGDALYQCGAGLTGFHVDPEGNLLGCVMTTEPAFNLVRDGSFLEGWNGAIRGLRDRKPDESSYLCNSCEMRGICVTCPALSKLENGTESRCSSYVCQTTQQRSAFLERWAGGAGGCSTGGGCSSGGCGSHGQPRPAEPIRLQVRRREKVG